MGYSYYLTGFSPVNKIGSFPIYIYNVQFYFVKGESVMGIVTNLGHEFSPFLRYTDSVIEIDIFVPRKLI